IPAAVGAIISRPEFMTAYTPYQPEVSQGTLQVIYEFQTHICRLTGMAVANASLYDGASAAAEAALVSTKVTGRNKVVVSETVNPLFRQVITTYLSGREMKQIVVPASRGRSDLNRMEDVLNEETACVLISQPNFFGLIEDAVAVARMIHKVGGKLIMAIDPIAQAILKTPAECGADIVVGEGQPLGLPLSFGGPLLGFFAATKELIRSMPGRIAGRTTDVDGKPGFVLVLQTREQHIRREKATSNICTNQALCATAASVYLTLLGKSGLKKVALLSAEKAQQTASALFELDGFQPYFDGPFVREFAVKTPIPARTLILAMIERGVLPGIDAGRWYADMNDCLIVAVTEKRIDEEIGRLVEGLKELSRRGVLSRMP
ncbi:MAG TPA: aminomethyl-transferring glycine dehydrogenase subunit GcvPA, partial [Candidatus Deferrimicrobium sp.]|nr:aminomethyl-transferring glycine dehydrogenase subunit GcvPA [Candidatus Deferrimicrobium sp.]